MTRNRTGLQKLGPNRRRRIDRALLKKFGPYCQWCRQYINRGLAPNDPMCWSRDHIVQVSEGGSNLIENIQPMHKICNEERSRFLNKSKNLLQVRIKRRY